MYSRLIQQFVLSIAIFLFAARPTHAEVVISEFMASNDRTLADEEGEYSDWIELFNAGGNPVPLDGWFLTDNPDRLTKWRLPAEILLPQKHLLVFASNKDRAIPGRHLHTNFRLASASGYLALVKPDGITSASVFGPGYPRQFTDISFGRAVEVVETLLITNRAPARLLVPDNALLEESWFVPESDDSAWLAVENGVGFESVANLPEPALIADSVADFSGEQGDRGWFYGYYNRTADPFSGYSTNDFILFPRSEAAFGPENYWDGTGWRYGMRTPPLTAIGAESMRPNSSTNGGFEHWAIRRWISPIAGTVRVQIEFAKETIGGTGVTLRTYRRASQIPSLSITIGGDDRTGTNLVGEITVVPGDRVDFALLSQGRSDTGDVGDLARLRISISQLASLDANINTDVGAIMAGRNSSAWLRIPFEVTNPGEFDHLLLNLRYDDGFIAYLNGSEVASANAPADPHWNSTATAATTDAAAIQPVEFDLSARHGLLQPGANLLAIHLLNAAIDDPDLLCRAELLTRKITLNPVSQLYLSPATPRQFNGAGNINLGPFILATQHQPRFPTTNEAVTVTARIAKTLQNIGPVTLTWRLMYSNAVTIPMLDDGAHGDGAAGDGVFGGEILATNARAGQMLRWYVSALDVSSNRTRFPAFPDRLRSPEFEGTVFADPSLTNPVPVFHFFVQNPGAADAGTTRCSIAYNGVFYDNIIVGIHGQSSREFPKHSYNFDMNPGIRFQYDPAEEPVDDFNLLTTYADKSKVRNILAYESFRDAGHPWHQTLPMRVQRNAAFFGDYDFVDDASETFLKRVGLNPDGAIYKMYSTALVGAGAAEKKTRKWENNADIISLDQGIAGRLGNKRNYLFDQVDIPAMVNFLATMILTGGVDCCHKNYYMYHDPATELWQALAWDVDLTFGRNWTGDYFDDKMYPQNGLNVGDNQVLMGALLADAAFKQMYVRRIRTLMDRLLQNTNTPVGVRYYETRIQELLHLREADAALDLAKWKTYGVKQTMAQAVDLLTTNYFPARRKYLFSQAGTGRPIPGEQPADVVVRFGTYEVTPASGSSNDEFIQIQNTNKFAVDISDWRLVGDIEHTFHPGTVIPASGFLYVSPDIVAFRRRSTSPRGSQGLNVQTGYRGQLSARGGVVLILDGLREVARLDLPANPTPAQHYLRVSEILFNSPIGAGSLSTSTDGGQFVELLNIGPEVLDLSRVHFTGGIVFSFAGSAITSLAPQERVVVVRNLATFIARYGTKVPVAGQFEGRLDPDGESLRLEEAGELVLEANYDAGWESRTRGPGYSLVNVDDYRTWTAWKNRAQWTAGGAPGGTPGLAERGYTQWLAHHFSALERNDPALAAVFANPDGDQWSNGEEFAVESDPNDPASPFYISAVSTGPSGAIELRFRAVANRTYTVQYRKSLTESLWLPLTTLPAGPAREISLPDPAPTSNDRYYRVIVSPRP